MSFLRKIFLSERRAHHFIALDIGTEVVKALVCVFDRAQRKGIVIGVGRARQKLGNMHSGAVSDITGVIATAKEAIDRAQEKAGNVKVKKAIIGIAGELVKGTTTTVHYERANANARIDLPELKNIIHKVQRKAYERIKKQLAWEIGKDLEIKLINAAIVDVRIDGYRVTNPIGFQGRGVSVSVFNAYAPMIHLGAIESIAAEIGVDLLNVAAEPYAVSSSVSYDDIIDFSAIFIDVGGGTTDIAVVRNGGLEGTKMFALGGRAFTKRLAKELGISFEEAEKLKITYAEGRLGSDVATKVEQILFSDCSVWLGGVELSLTEFAENDLLPSTIYLCGGGSGLPGIKKALADPAWVRHLPFAKAPRISFLQPRDIVRIVDRTAELINPQDVTPMALATLAVDMADEEQVMASLLRRALRTIQE